MMDEAEVTDWRKKGGGGRVAAWEETGITGISTAKGIGSSCNHIHS